MLRVAVKVNSLDSLLGLKRLVSNATLLGGKSKVYLVIMTQQKNPDSTKCTSYTEIVMSLFRMCLRLLPASFRTAAVTRTRPAASSSSRARRTSTANGSTRLAPSHSRWPIRQMETCWARCPTATWTTWMRPCKQPRMHLKSGAAILLRWTAIFFDIYTIDKNFIFFSKEARFWKEWPSSPCSTRSTCQRS